VEGEPSIGGANADGAVLGEGRHAVGAGVGGHDEETC
jgi:hypothetical protein